MGKIEREFQHSPNPWIERSPGNDAQVLSVDEETGAFTRISRLEPGCDTTPQGQQIHRCWEEVFIVSGSAYDVGLKEWFTQGMYAVRPPGMPHGPWIAGDEGCVFLEWRYGIVDDAERLAPEDYETP